jgi:hypothetical protein
VTGAKIIVESENSPFINAIGEQKVAIPEKKITNGTVQLIFEENY